MGFFDFFKPKKANNKQAEIQAKEDEYLTQKVKDYAEKYLTDMVEQLNQMDRIDFVALPSVLGNKEFGKKELPLRCAVKEAYSINPIVYSCVNAISQTASTVPFILQKKEKVEGQYTSIFTHPILELLNCPNKTQTQSEFIEYVVAHLLLCGNAIVWKNTAAMGDRNKKYKGKSEVKELIVLDPDWIDYKDNGFEIVSYHGREKSPYEGNQWDPEEIIHFRLVNPLNPFWGMSPLQAAYRAIDIDSQILEWWINSLEQGCKKDMLFRFKHDLTDAQFKRVRNLIDQQVAGFRQGRGYMILGHEADVTFLNMAPAELDFTKSRQKSSQEIMGIFRVPPPIIGDLEHSTYNNIREARQSFWLDTIMPLLNDISSVLSKSLLPNFGLSLTEYELSYDHTEVEALQRSLFEQWDCVVKMVNVGVPLNMAIKHHRIQMPHIEGGDYGYISHNLVPLGFYDDSSDPNKEASARESNPRNPEKPNTEQAE